MIEGNATGLEIFPSSVGVSRLKDGARPVVRLQLKNTGSVPVSVIELRKSCGCMVPNLRLPVVVEADGEVSFNVTLMVPDVGEKSVNMSFLWNSPNGGRGEVNVPVSLKGNALRPPYIQSPVNALTLQTSSVDSPANREFAICTVESSNSDRWIEGAVADNSQFRLEILGVAENPYTAETVQRTYTVRATATPLKGDRAASSANVVWKLRTADVVKPAAPFVLNLDIQPVFEVVPRRVRLNSKTSSAELLILARTAEGGELFSVREKPEWLNVEVRPTANKKVTKVRVTTVSPTANAPKSGSVVIETSGAEGSTVSFDVAIASPASPGV